MSDKLLSCVAVASLIPQGVGWLAGFLCRPLVLGFIQGISFIDAYNAKRTKKVAVEILEKKVADLQKSA